MYQELFDKFDKYSTKTDATLDGIHQSQETLDNEMIQVNGEMDKLITDMQAKLSV